MNRIWLACVCIGVVALTVSGCGETSGGSAAPLEGFVCGKDGATYSVEDAARGEQDVEHRGRCDEPMHCGSPNDCFVGDACMPAPWAAGDDRNEPGADPTNFQSDRDAYWCIPGPTRCNCPGVFEPVCGGDGRNYINACEAACAGVGIRHEGYCEEPPGKGCVRAGCSGQLCVEEGMDIASTCEWRPVYECYQEATCERQLNGQCSFTPTHELVECLEHFGEGMCRVDPRWQDGFEAECESPQVPGIIGIVAVSPYEMMRLGEPFRASFQLLDPPIFDAIYSGEGLLRCDEERTLFEGLVMMTPLGDLEIKCRILPETHPGECLDDSDCPPGHYCQRIDGWPDDGVVDPSIPEPPPRGVCMDLCALIDCAPGYVCELGECIPQHGVCDDDYDCPVGWICREGILGAPEHEGVCERCACPEIYSPVCGVDGRTYGNACEARCTHVRVAHEGECENECPVETHIRNFQGECVPKCYGPEQCGDEQHCNAAEVCLQDPACPACDVCVGWCVPPAGDCRTNGCAAGWTCDYCQTADGQAEWICLPPNAGACLPLDECRPTGCNGEICANQDVASPCVALPEFACYQEVGICELRPWGQCGWTPTPELDECLSQFDCRTTGCGDGHYCGYCWTSWECLPEGAVC
jgi:eight-cysteine-cluster-containing protein